MMLSIVLDLDDTLYLERDYVASGFAALAVWVEERLAVTGFGDAAWRAWEAGRTTRTFDHVLTGLGITPEAGLIGLMRAVYRTHRPAITLLPDAARFLAVHGESDLALVTDGPVASQRAKIEALDLVRFGLDPLICTDEWGEAFRKPHPRAFEAVMHRHGEKGRAFIYVADNPAKDFLAPRALGWRTVQIDRPGAIHRRVPPSERHRADISICSFDELTDERLTQLLRPGACSS